MSLIKLPKTYKGDNKNFQGKPMVSWSQIETFIATKGFNTKLLGKYEYMRKYFLGETYPDMGWGQFGNEAEAWITVRDLKGDDLMALKKKDKDSYEALIAANQNFTTEEKAILEKITPLGNFQHEAIIDFGSFVLLGFLDDVTDDFLHIRDYKTKSQSTMKKLVTPDTYQLEVYGLYIQKMLGITPEKYEYCVIERLGGRECMQGGGREVLSVGKNVWYLDKEVTPERLKETEKLIVDTVKEISSHYKTFLKYNK